MRSKHLVTVLGTVDIERPYYLCPGCHHGYSPRDVELDTTGTEYSPGVRRMMAVVGSEASFEHGRQQLELLAGIDVTAKAVERQAEAIGDDIAQKEKLRSTGALQLELPEIPGPAVPILYIELFRRQHLSIGSGVLEAACKTVIGSRLKQSGMFWTVQGANAIIALRCHRLSRKFEDYWAYRSRAA